MNNESLSTIEMNDRELTKTLDHISIEELKKLLAETFSSGYVTCMYDNMDYDSDDMELYYNRMQCANPYSNYLTFTKPFGKEEN